MIAKQEKIVDYYSTEQAWHPEEELIRDYGSNSLAFFGLAPENRHFLTPDGAGLVNYRLVSNVAVVLGDPVCSSTSNRNFSPPGRAAISSPTPRSPYLKSHWQSCVCATTLEAEWRDCSVAPTSCEE